MREMRIGLCAVTMVVTGCVSPTGAPGADDVAASEEEIIFDAEDWNDITAFETSPTYQIGALYGRATAGLFNRSQVSEDDEPFCSGFLIDDEILVTAHHCRRGSFSSPQPIVAQFGEFDLGLLDARERMRSLGFPVPQAQNMAFDGSAREWTCDFIASDYPTYRRDIDYYRCRPNRVTPWAPAGAPIVDLLPGHVWGHMNVTTRRANVDDRIYVLSVNDPSWQIGDDDVLLSPSGSIWDDWDDLPVSDDGFDYNGGFEWGDSDTLCGSSGGPVLYRNGSYGHQVLGVVHGQYDQWGGDSCRRTRVSEDSWSLNFYSNTGTYLMGQARTMSSTAPLTETMSVRWHYDTTALGGTGGSEHVAQCPSGFAVAGFVGETIDGGSRDGVVGNLGVVCLPFRNRHTTVNGVIPWELDRAVVLSAGSVNTPRIGSGGEDFNTYHHERLVPNSTYGLPNGEQTLMICPPGTYVTGVEVRADSMINMVRRLECGSVSRNGAGYDVNGIGWQTGHRTIGERNYGSTQTSECGSRAIFSGVRFRAGWYTDRLQPRCAQL
ncbi:MAG: hypothetical protein VYE22_00565 [Myxococcota bacterium]|nr:hypothetical protein [Myxococcota bacterium]